MNDEEEEESEDMRRKIRESLRIFEDQRRKKAEVKERKALINQCMKRTQEIEMASKKVWEQIKEEVRQMNRRELEKYLELPMELSEIEQIELEEIICNRKNYFENKY